MAATKKTKTPDSQASAYIARVLKTMQQHGVNPDVPEDEQRKVAEQVARAFRDLRPAT